MAENLYKGPKLYSKMSGDHHLSKQRDRVSQIRGTEFKCYSRLSFACLLIPEIKKNIPLVCGMLSLFAPHVPSRPV